MMLSAGVKLEMVEGGSVVKSMTAQT